MLNSSQGRARPMQMSKTLLPMEELTALSPKPCLATDRFKESDNDKRNGNGCCMRGEVMDARNKWTAAKE